MSINKVVEDVKKLKTEGFYFGQPIKPDDRKAAYQEAREGANYEKFRSYDRKTVRLRGRLQYYNDDGSLVDYNS